jgi:type II secretory pathway pseudopilin PulG
MLTRRIVPFFAIVLAAGVVCPVLRAQSQDAQSQDVAEAARKAKEKKQQQQTQTQTQTPAQTQAPTQTKTQTDSAPAKPKKTYTNEDIPESKSAEKPDAGPTKEDSATVTLEIPSPSVTRPWGTNVLWSVHNTSDHFIQFTILLVVTGPCGYHQEHPLRFSLNPGGRAGVGNGAFATAFYKEDCPGVYTFELRALCYRKLLDSATATTTVL